MQLFAKRQTARGRVIIAQEQTFRLATDDGPTLLLILSVHGKTPSEQVLRFRDAGTPVEVTYEGEPGFDSGAAYSLRPL